MSTVPSMTDMAGHAKSLAAMARIIRSRNSDPRLSVLLDGFAAYAGLLASDLSEPGQGYRNCAECGYPMAAPSAGPHCTCDCGCPAAACRRNAGMLKKEADRARGGMHADCGPAPSGNCPCGGPHRPEWHDMAVPYAGAVPSDIPVMREEHPFVSRYHCTLCYGD